MSTTGDWPQWQQQQTPYTINSIYDVNPAFLGDLQQWLQINPFQVPYSQITGVPPAAAPPAPVNPARLIAINRFTTTQSIIGTGEPGNGIVSLGSLTFDGNPIFFEFFCPRVVSPSGGNTVNVLLLEDGVVLGQIARINFPGAANIDAYSITAGYRKDSPTAGAHTYQVRGNVGSGSADFQAGSGGSGTLAPGYLRVSKDDVFS